MYVKLSNGAVDQYPYTVGDLRRDNPNTSFPKKPSDEMLADWDVYPVTMLDIPSHNQRTQSVQMQTTPTLKDGSWEIGYNVVNKTTDDITDYDNQQAMIHRSTRNTLLSNTDWTQMNDSPLSNEDKTAWATYRQELRSITDLDAWPNLSDDDWPTKPS